MWTSLSPDIAILLMKGIVYGILDPIFGVRWVKTFAANLAYNLLRVWFTPWSLLMFLTVAVIARLAFHESFF